MKITNTQAGPRGVNAISGPVLIEAGQTAEVEVYAREKAHLEASGWFEIKGDYTPDPGSPTAAGGERDENGDTPEMAQLRSMFDSQWKKLTADHDKAKAELETASGAATSLKDRIAELELENEDLKAQIAKLTPAGPTAKHRGGGSYSVMEGDKELVEKLDKDAAEKFNAMDDAAKAAFIEANKKG